MIVKNESRVIQRCFDSVCDYIDYWVICDTGSTDGTQDIIKNYFKEKNIPGKLLQHEWVDFGYNRTKAVQAAYRKADYLLLMDADFKFCIHDPNFKRTNLNHDGYQIKYEGALDYRQLLFASGKKKWKYIGVTHEYITCPNAKNIGKLDAFTIDHLADGGCRSDKFERDIRLLTEGLKTEPDNIRYMFYLAQSHKDLKHWNDAIKYYQMRAERGGWSEEVYYSLYQIGLCKIMRGDPYEEFSKALLKAHKYRPVRLEALHKLVNYCRLNDMMREGYEHAISAINNKYPSQDMLFIEKDIHNWKFYDELALCAYYCDKPMISLKIYKRLKDQDKIPSYQEKRFNENYNWFKKGYEKKIRSEYDTVHPPKRKIIHDKKVIVSLTTIPSRIPNLVSTLDSIKNQTYTNIEINLCVPKYCEKEKCGYEIPEFILTDSMINVVVVEEDYGAATKLFGSLKVIDDPDAYIIVVDDDFIYHPNLVERLMESADEYEEAAIGFCGWNAQMLVDTGIFYELLYDEENVLDKNVTPANILEGYRGVLYRRKFFDYDVFDYDGYPEALKRVDDVWIGGYLASKNIPKIIVKYFKNQTLTIDQTWNEIWVENHEKPKEENNSISSDPNFVNDNKTGAASFENKYPDIWEQELIRIERYIKVSDKNNIPKWEDLNLEHYRVAIFIVNHNMKDATDKLVDQIETQTQHPHDIIVIDTGSDLDQVSDYTTVRLSKNIYTTNGWLMGLRYTDTLELVGNFKYFSYCFIKPGVEILSEGDVIGKMIHSFIEDSDVVGIHPSLSTDSLSAWKNMIHTPNTSRVQVFSVDNIFSCYRSYWFNEIERFNKELLYGWGIDIETGYYAHNLDMKILVDNRVEIRFPGIQGDVDDAIASNNMLTYFRNTYGDESRLYENLNHRSDYDEIVTDLQEGVTFLIRAKNEEMNIQQCLNTLWDTIKDIPNTRIIFVDNGSTDKTYEYAEQFLSIGDRFELYKFDREIRKVMEENSNKCPISEFYNWCLDKVKTYNIIKWDADFVSQSDNLRELLLTHNLNTRNDHFALWFTGSTVFEHDGVFTEKTDNYYDEYRVYSKLNGFKWIEMATSEHPDISKVTNRIKYLKPVFYEIKRTSVNEFESRVKFIDRRDREDHAILSALERNMIPTLERGKSALKRLDSHEFTPKNRRIIFFVYYGYTKENGGTNFTVKTYIKYLLSQGDVVYIFERLPNDQEVELMKPDCILSVQFASLALDKLVPKWKVPWMVFTYGSNQYVFRRDGYPSMVTYPNEAQRTSDPNQKNAVIVRDPVDHRLYEIDPNQKDPTYITLIGDPPNIKNHALFIELAKRFPEEKFMLVTKHNYEKGELSDNIKLQGYVTGIDNLKEFVYSKIKVFLLPSIQEAFGRVSIEAIASDIPCIISNFPGLPDATFGMSNYIDPKDTDKWESELRRVLSEYPNEVEKSRQIHDKFDFDQDVNHVRDIIREVIENFEQ